jgi:hypothetical protein
MSSLVLQGRLTFMSSKIFVTLGTTTVINMMSTPPPMTNMMAG